MPDPIMNPTPDSSRRDLLHEYQHLREHLLDLHMRLLKTIPSKVRKNAGEKLGLRRLELDEDGLSTVGAVWADYTLYHYRPGGQTLFEQHFEAHPPEPGSHLDEFRQMLATYRYTIVEVEALEPGVGAEVYDIFRDTPLFLMDRGLSASARPGMLLATGLLWWAKADAVLTTGAGLPIGWGVFSRIEQRATRLLGDLDDVDFDHLPPRKASDLAALIIREALQGGAAEGIQYR